MLTREQNEMLCRSGPGTPAGELFRRFWIPALLAEELPAPDCQPVRVRLLNEDLVAYRDSGGKVGLLTESCPHRRASLWYGRNEEGGLRCVYHGWKFNWEGHCVDMPNEPAESNFKNKVHITAYPVEERGGVIWAYMGPKDKVADFPQYEWTLLPETHRFVGKIFIECNYQQALEGEIDNSHVSFLHSTLTDASALRGTFVSAGPSMVQNQFVDRIPRGFVKETDCGIMMGWRRNFDAEHYHWRVNQWTMPFATMISMPEGATQLIVHRPPRDDESSWMFAVHYNPDRPLTVEELDMYRTGRGFIPALVPGSFRPQRNPDNDFRIDRSLQRSFNYTGIGGFYEQDLAVTTSMGAIVDRSKEHLGTADAVLIAVRRRLLKMARDLQNGVEPYAVRHGEVFNIRGAEGVLDKMTPFDAGFRKRTMVAVG